MSKNEKVFFIFRYKWSPLGYLIDQGYNIRNRASLEKEYRYVRAMYFGWKEGLEEFGYRVKLFDNPNYLVPALLRKIAPKFYVLILRLFGCIAITRQIRDFVYNLILFAQIKIGQPGYLVYSAKWLAPFVISACKKQNCTSIEYRGTTPQVGGWKGTMARNPDVVVSGFDATRFSQIEIKGSFYRIDLGPSANLYGKPHYGQDARPFDLSAIGRYDDGVFSTRSQIMNALLGREFSCSLSLILRGYFSFRQKENYKALIKKGESPIYGRAYVDSLKSSKLALVIPSDDHIEAGEGMPMRVFQNAAAGCMQLVYRCKAIEGIFTDQKEIVFFDNVDDLVEKLKYYLLHDDERIKIAQNAYQRYLEEYTAQRQIQKLFRALKA
jgi:glycosyltransferase involved in cell wall biosynthesis